VVYRVSPAAALKRDLDLIEDYLIQAYQGFGEDHDSAAGRAISRVKDALDYLDDFAIHPHRGTEQARIRPGLRSVTRNRFIYYFEIDEPLTEVRILAVFFGGMDHQRQIQDRLG
jgi:toxin ParE1/3/4